MIPHIQFQCRYLWFRAMRLHSQETTMKRISILTVVTLLAALQAFAGGAPKSSPQQAVDRIMANERALSATMRNYSPMVETYLQHMQPDSAMGFLPAEDHYF